MEKSEINILLVENNPENTSLMSRMLKDSDFPLKLTHADRIKSALEFLDNERFDIVLLDIELPDSIGLSGLEKILAHGPGIPVLILTDLYDENLGIRAVQKNAEDYLVKDRVNPNSLIRSIRYAIERRRGQREREITVEFLRLVNECTTARELVRAAVIFFQRQSGCQAIGIRLRDGDDYPYFETCGFPEHFVKKENSLYSRDFSGELIKDKKGNPIIECMCGNVICGNFNSQKQSFSTNGSFWTNSTTQMRSAECGEVEETVEMKIATTPPPSEPGLPDLPGCTRNHCSSEGYESIALIPLGTGKDRLGLLQMNDRKKGVFSPSLISLWERLANQLASAVAKFRTEQALHEKEERYRGLVEMSPEAIFVNRNNAVTYANKAALRLFGASSPEDFLGRSIFDLYHPDYHPLLRKRLKLLIDGKPVPLIETRALRPDGTIIDVEVAASPFFEKGVLSIQVLVRDITERKKRDMELCRLNRILKTQSQSNQVMIRAKNESDYMNKVCGIIIRTCGYSMVWIGFAENDEGKSIRPAASSGFEKDHLETLKGTWADTELGYSPAGIAIRTGKPGMCRNILTDPASKPWREQAIRHGYSSSIGFPLKTANRVFGAISIYSREPDPFTKDEMSLLSELADDLAYGITAIRLRADLYKSEQNANAILNAITESIWLVDSEGRILAANSIASERMGIQVSEIRGRNYFDLMPLCLAEPQRAQTEKVFRSGISVRFEEKKSDMTFDYSFYPVRNEKGNIEGVAIFAKDITGLKKAEEILRRDKKTLRKLVRERSGRLMEIQTEMERSKRLSDIGSLAATVAHELRNPLAGIRLATAVVKSKNSDSVIAEQLQGIDNMIAESGQIIDNLLFYSRLGPPQRKILNVHSLLKECTDTLQHLRIEKNMVISSRTNSLEDVPISADPIQIREVFTNILNNAAEAVSDHDGEINVEAGIYQKSVRIRITDNGHGMTGEVLKKAFNPFFTTNAKGTGLGLTVCSQIVKMHGGSISIKSRNGEGTTVTITLPKEKT